MSEAPDGRPESPPEQAFLDSASGEPLHPSARAMLERSLDLGYADPRRLHHPARQARLLLDNARASVAESLGVRPDEVTFTPSGTHAVHLGLLGLRRGSPTSGGRILHTAVEHSAVLHAAHWTGGPVTSLAVDTAGRLAEMPTPAGASVVAVQAANHEVGTIQPVEQVADSLGDVPLFTDACASMGRLALPNGWATAAGSAHKWGGPAGVGVLLVRKGARWRNPFPGDDRVDERTTGFENVPAALAAAAALQAVVAEREQVNPRQFALVERLRTRLAEVPDTEVAGDPSHRLPHLVTFSCLYVDGEALVNGLSRHGFAVASGSACTASTLEPSHVLAAMGVLTHGNVRVSLGRETTTAEVDRFVEVLPRVVGELRAEAGLA